METLLEGDEDRAADEEAHAVGADGDAEGYGDPVG